MACSDAGEEDYSAFSPEIFVAKEYSPFFYDNINAYYGTNYSDDNNTRFNDLVIDEWYDYLNRKISKETIRVLLFKTSVAGVDSVQKKLNGRLSLEINKLSKVQADAFFNYLSLAKACEKFTVRDQYSYWEKPVPITVPTHVEAALLKAFQKPSDQFIKERLWFQLVRCYYFKNDSTAGKSQLPAFFNTYQRQFPKNLIYYRTMGYLAGYDHQQKNYAEANYLYSLCYDYTSEMKIPSKWSFHPQEETDWQATLKLAKNNHEKITLWHLLGMQYDPARAIRNIVALDPKTDKMDLLLSRLINIKEDSQPDSAKTDSANLKAASELKLIDGIALKNNTAKPYFWNLAAGYLNYLEHNYTVASDFYKKAKQQFPANDRPLKEQGRLLDALLYVGSITAINPEAEHQLVGILNWLADLRDRKDTVNYLRYQWALGRCTSKLADLYHAQNNRVKELCFRNQTDFYLDSSRVENLKKLLQKPVKSDYEKVLLRYYPLKIADIYYYQATLQVYKENLDKAVLLMKLATGNNKNILLANPFTNRIVDCHDCDQTEPQKQKYTSLSFLLRLQTLQKQLKFGKNAYGSALLLANAYYNITHYGNCRSFYESQITGSGAVQPDEIYKSFQKLFASSKLAEKYYLIARRNALTAEQKAECTFMAAKCEHNSFYTMAFEKNSYNAEGMIPPAGKYFAELKSRYAKTRYYKEALAECGYLKDYVKNGK